MCVFHLSRKKIPSQYWEGISVSYFCAAPASFLAVAALPAGPI